MTQNFDIGIRCGYLLTQAPGQTETLRDYFIGIKGHEIVSVVPYPKKKPKCKKFIDASTQAVLPGFVNGHCHQGMNLFRGIADDLPFQTWLFEKILPLEQALVTPQLVSQAVELAVVESIQFGITTTCDMYFYVEKTAEVHDRAGTRAILGVAVTDAPAPDAKNIDEAFKRTEKLAKKYANHKRIQIGYGPHAPYTCSDALFHKMLEHNQWDLPIMLHVSETRREIEDSIKQYGMTPPQRLKKLGLFEKRLIMHHCVHLTPEDMNIISKAKRIGIIHNPESNMKLGVGVSPVPELLRAGVALGLGTDGVCSNNNLNFLGEVASASRLHKCFSGDLTAVSARQALEMATLMGARAIGLDHHIGSIEEGKFADIVIMDVDVPHMQPLYDLPSQIVYAATGLEISTVLCHGKVLMENRKFKTLNPKKAMAQAKAYAVKARLALK